MPRESRSYLVTGRVQGVGFRAAAAAQARGLSLDGWVRNRFDGRVEALAWGETAALSRFEDWLRQGPRGALVTKLTVTAVASEPAPGFQIRPDSDGG